MDLQVVGCGAIDWIEVAQDIDNFKRRAVLQRVMK